MLKSFTTVTVLLSDDCLAGGERCSICALIPACICVEDEYVDGGLNKCIDTNRFTYFRWNCRPYLCSRVETEQTELITRRYPV